MPEKKQLLLKSIRELLSLNVPDDEIAQNLKEVGIDSSQVKSLIEEAKRPRPPSGKEIAADEFFEKFDSRKKGAISGKMTARKRARKIERERELATEELATQGFEPEKKPVSEEIARDLGFESPEKAEPLTSKLLKTVSSKKGEKKDTAPTEKPEPVEKILETPSIEPEKKQRLIEDITVSKLWEKGIIGAVNQRLAEMKEIKEDLDKNLDKRVGKATEKEKERTKVLFDSQRALLISKVDAEIEKKAKGFADLIEMKLREMREINKQIAENTEKSQTEGKKSKSEGKSLSRRLKELDKVKEDLLASLNSEIIQAKTQNKQLVEAMNKNLNEMDNRINKTLQLENQIVEGLVQEAKHNIGQMIEEKSQQFSEDLKSKSQQLNALKESFEAEEKKQAARLETQIQTSRGALDHQIKERLLKLDQLQKAITVELKPERFRELMQELNEFKAQFVEAIRQNAEKYNEGIKKMNEQSTNIEKQLKLRTEKIDKKIAELDAFEKNFAKEMGLGLEKLTKKENKKEKK